MAYGDTPKLTTQTSTSSTTTTTTTMSAEAIAEAAATKNIWSHILQEVQNSTKKSPPPKSIILLGDNESGRSTLVARLKNVESISKGIGLEYHYIDIKDEDRDDIPKLGVWIPDGDGSCTNLLKFSLNENNFEHTLIAFVVSMSSPWSIMESLNKWSTILNDHIKKLNLTEEKRRECLNRQIRQFQSYQDPDDSSAHKDKLATNDGASSGSAVLTKMSSVEKDDELIYPLDSSILNKNIGISVIVIVTKSDCLSVLDKEMEYRIEHYDFIQYHIRRFCLDYGASLFYTTVKDKRTYDKLYKYMVHKLYDYTFSIPASVVERESIFIPSGWDNEGKINILLENSTTIKSDTQFSEIIYKPSIRKPLPRDVETVVAYEDQEFLSKLQILLNKTATPAVKSDDLASMVSNPGPSPVSLGGGAHKTPHKPPVLKNNPNQPDSTNLKNFFQNLLNKNAPTPASTTSPASTIEPKVEPISPPANE